MNVELVSAKCPNCNGEIQLDSSQVTGFCLYCGSQLIVKDAIQLYGKVEVDGIATIENLMIRARQCLDTADMDEAETFLDRILEIDPLNHEAWWGKYKAEIRTNKNENQPMTMVNGSYINLQQIVQNNNYQLIAAIKELREKTHIGLKEAKDLVEAAMRNPSGTWVNQSNTLTEKALLYANRAIEYAPDDFASAYKKELEERKNMTSMNIRRPQPSSSSGCYIATAVYGDYNCHEVLILRQYRDNVLAKSLGGKIFIKGYYLMSPPIARVLKQTKKINRWVKLFLDKLVAKLEIKNM